MSDSGDRTHIPFLMILVFAFLLVAIVFFGPELKRLVASQIGSGSGQFTFGTWDPFSAIFNGIQSFGKSVGDLFFRARP